MNIHGILTGLKHDLRHRVRSAKRQADTDLFWSALARKIAPAVIEEFPTHLLIDNDIMVGVHRRGHPAVQHRRLELYKKGYQTPDIARMTNRTVEESERYIKAYKKVEKLNRTMKSKENAQILGMGKSLVDEYIRILILNEE